MIFLLVACHSFCARSENSVPRSSARPRIGLALAGGGALGFAHVGVLKVLEENRIPVEIVTGTSMGSIVGAAYASGISVAEMTEVLTNTDWDALFSESVPREALPYRSKPGRNREIYGDVKVSFNNSKLAMPTGAIQGQNFLPLLQRLLGRTPSPVSFDKLPLRFRAVTADIETGLPVVPTGGDLATVVRARMSVPGAFAPVEIDGRLLVDGGIANNLPIDVAQQLGSERVIAVELYASYKKREELTSPFAITGQIVSILLAQNSALQRQRLTPQDILIEPEIKDFTATDFAKGAQIMQRGEDAARKVVKQLRQYSVSEQEYGTYVARRTRSIATSPPIISALKVEQNSHLADVALLTTTGLKVGDSFDREKIEAGVKGVYQLGEFERVRYETKDTDQGREVTIRAVKKPWIDDYFRLGAAIQDDFAGNASYRLGAIYRNSAISTAGSYLDVDGEIGFNPRLRAELFQTLGASSPYFLTPELSIGRNNILIRRASDNIARYFRDIGHGSLAFGRQLGTSGEAKIGITRGMGRLDRNIGSPDLPKGDFEIGETSATITFDTFDNPDLPSSGVRAYATAVSSFKELGASDDFNQVKGLISKAFTYDNKSLILKFDGANTFQKLPGERSLSLGGFLDVSGYAPNSIIASDYALFQALLINRVSSFKSPILKYDVFLGSTLEMLALRSDLPTIQDKSQVFSASLFCGLDTPIFPVYLGVGKSEGPHTSVYLAIDRIGASQR